MERLRGVIYFYMTLTMQRYIFIDCLMEGKWIGGLKNLVMERTSGSKHIIKTVDCFQKNLL